MNRLKSTITKMQTVDNLNIVAFTLHNHSLKMMSLDLGEDIQVATEVIVHFKSTSVAIGKENNSDLSICNQLPVKILSIEEGLLVSLLRLEFHAYTLESIITTSSLQRMNLAVGERVIALVKSSDLSIKEVL